MRRMEAVGRELDGEESQKRMLVTELLSLAYKLPCDECAAPEQHDGSLPVE